MGLLKGKCQGEYYVWHKKYLGERIFQMWRKDGLSQKQLGDVVGLSHQAISTKVSSDYLLGITDDPPGGGMKASNGRAE